MTNNHDDRQQASLSCQWFSLGVISDQGFPDKDGTTRRLGLPIVWWKTMYYANRERINVWWIDENVYLI